MTRWIKLIGTGFGSGLVPKFPGSSGTLVGCALWWFMKDLPLWVYVLTLVAAFPAGAWICAQNEHRLNRKDSPEIVIDEILAFPLAMLLIPPTPLTFLLGYLVFRLYDILKPYPCRQLETIPKGYGVMADDYMAALYTCVTLHGLNFLVPLFA
jgi:phosphatidylglycerophosphatase A